MHGKAPEAVLGDCVVHRWHVTPPSHDGIDVCALTGRQQAELLREVLEMAHDLLLMVDAVLPDAKIGRGANRCGIFQSLHLIQEQLIALGVVKQRDARKFIVLKLTAEHDGPIVFNLAPLHRTCCTVDAILW